MALIKIKNSAEVEVEIELRNVAKLLYCKHDPGDGGDVKARKGSSDCPNVESSSLISVTDLAAHVVANHDAIQL